MTLGLGIIGAGRIGRVHADTLTTRVPGAKLHIIADIHAPSAKAAADDYGIPAHSDDPAALFDMPELDAVLICSSTDTHTRFIKMAAQAGKHIFCEKPIDHDLAEIDAALAAVDAAGVQLQVGFNRRFDANHLRLKQAIETGEIGAPQLLHIISRDPAPPPIDYIEVSGGMMMDMMIHDFDMCRFLLGEVVEVFAMGACMVDPAIGAAGDIDTAKVMLRFENGVIGSIENSRQAVYGYDQRVEVFGSQGAASSGNRHANAVTLSDGQSVRRDLPLNFFMDRYMDSYAAEMAAFVQAIATDQPVPVNGQDGRAPVLMAKAGLRSLRENRLVRLDEIDGD
ncbi:MAG: inositol 2-dehydrogenase [Chloroflexi bacterium]|nr:inositol 2-dehydrogenase [Chloroflexota bacterium]MXX51413.1 inositol 2-dehydrogenase [Chloroflexota bacterium]MYA93685.1 inositol 2-dehydrogenase [Chloroflexota bacterium]MYD37841.1 inositol 2-dehydrogenase [Chloroflexota bacterium]MYI40433.1 inositol 2-dehydrogenase [Chloroflexota bacterium]